MKSGEIAAELAIKEAGVEKLAKSLDGIAAKAPAEIAPHIQAFVDREVRRSIEAMPAVVDAMGDSLVAFKRAVKGLREGMVETVAGRAKYLKPPHLRDDLADANAGFGYWEQLAKMSANTLGPLLSGAGLIDTSSRDAFWTKEGSSFTYGRSLGFGPTPSAGEYVKTLAELIKVRGEVASKMKELAAAMAIERYDAADDS